MEIVHQTSKNKNKKNSNSSLKITVYNKNRKVIWVKFLIK